MWSSSPSERIINECNSQMPELYSNLSTQEKNFVRCQYCFLNKTDMEELLTKGKCLPSDYTDHLTLVLILYGVILLISLPGNVLVVCTVAMFKKLHTVTHYFIANLAVGDLLMTVFCIPFSVLSIIVLQFWPFGKVLCVAVNYFQAVSVFVSAYTHVAISIDRYLAIIYPLRPRLSRFQAKAIIASVWGLAFGTTAPVAIFSKLVQPEGERFYAFFDLKVCQEQWPEGQLAKSYTLALTLLQYFLPLFVLIFTYCRIALQVWGSSLHKGKPQLRDKDSLTLTTSRPLNASKAFRKSASDHSPAKMIRMTLTVVLVYSLCWLPFNVLQVVREYWPKIHEWQYAHFLWFICHWLAMSHACYNPIILCWMNAKFKACLFALLNKKLNCFVCKKSPKRYRGSSRSCRDSSTSFRKSGNTSITMAGSTASGAMIYRDQWKRTSSGASFEPNICKNGNINFKERKEIYGDKRDITKGSDQPDSNKEPSDRIELIYMKAKSVSMRDKGRQHQGNLNTNGGRTVLYINGKGQFNGKETTREHQEKGEFFFSSIKGEGESLESLNIGERDFDL